MFVAPTATANSDLRKLFRRSLGSKASSSPADEGRWSYKSCQTMSFKTAQMQPFAGEGGPKWTGTRRELGNSFFADAACRNTNELRAPRKNFDCQWKCSLIMPSTYFCNVVPNVPDKCFLALRPRNLKFRKIIINNAVRLPAIHCHAKRFVVITMESSQFLPSMPRGAQCPQTVRMVIRDRRAELNGSVSKQHFWRQRECSRSLGRFRLSHTVRPVGIRPS